MASTTHRQTPPSGCGSCVKIRSILVQHARRALGQPLTGAAIAAAAGIARQTALFHIAHQIECGWLEADGRTPVKLPKAARSKAKAAFPPPLEWVADLALSCRTCGRLMVVLATNAKGAWTTQMSESEIARALGVTPQTVRTHIAALTGHRPHVRHPLPGKLLRGEMIPDTGGRGGLLWVFLGGRTITGSAALSYTPAEYAKLRTRALDLLARVEASAPMNGAERRRAAEVLIIERFQLGYTSTALLAAMTEPGDTATTAHTSAYGLIKWRLDVRAPLSGYVPTVPELLDPTPRVQECECGKAFKARLSVTHCGPCRRRVAAGISLEVAEAFPLSEPAPLEAGEPPATYAVWEPVLAGEPAF